MFVNEVTNLVSSMTPEPQVLGIDFQSRVPWLQPLVILQNRCFWPVLIWFAGLASLGFLAFCSSLNLWVGILDCSWYFWVCLYMPYMCPWLFFFVFAGGPYCVPCILLEGAKFLLGFAIVLSWPGPIVPTEKWCFEQVKLIIYVQYLSITHKVYKINDFTCRIACFWNIFFQFYWDTIDIQHCISLKL